MAETIKYVSTTVQPGDLGVFKDSATGTYKVQNIDTGTVEQVYNTSGAAEQYKNLRESGQGLTTADKNVRAGDPGQSSDSNTTASNTTSANTPVLNPITKEVTSQQPASDSNQIVNSTQDSSVAGEMSSLDPYARAKEMAKPQNENGTPLTAEVTTGTGKNPVANVNLSDTTPSQPTPPPVTKFPNDWRVRLSLAKEATYLYKEQKIESTNILFPLKETDGVIFPYLPQINVSYRANYSPTEITHTNYKNFFYTNSSVDDINITADFTAQDNIEAKYMLAVIHFFKSVTKMFYGQDVGPRGGTPPPLCYLTGLGAYQFNNHPIVITNFAYNLPNDVDYIRTETNDAFSAGGISSIKKQQPKSNIFSKFLSDRRLGSSNLNKFAQPSQPNFSSITSAGTGITYVPTKLQIQITAHPIVTRKDISENFKLTGKDSYSSGKLTKGGIW
jgi:hypothetical protein